MARDYAAVPHEYLEEMSELTDEEFGRLIRALLAYSGTGRPIVPCGNERFYVNRVTAEEDRHRRSYDELTEARSRAGRAGAEARARGRKTQADDAVQQTQANAGAAQQTQANGSTRQQSADTDTDTETDTEAEADTEAEVISNRSPKTREIFFPPKPPKRAPRRRRSTGLSPPAGEDRDRWMNDYP